MGRRGYFTLARIFGAPLRIHWSAPVGAFLFGGGGLRPGAWLAFLVVIVVHELGHAFLVRRRGLRVARIDVHALGGECAFGGEIFPRDAQIVAWGGVLAQLALLVPALVLRVMWGDVLFATPFLADLASGLVERNALLIALNLLPFPPLDGALAWKLFTSRRGQGRSDSRPRPRLRDEPATPLGRPKPSRPVAPSEPAPDVAQVREEVQRVLRRANEEAKARRGKG